MLIECVLLASSLCRAVKDKPVMALTAAHTASVIADGITTKHFERLGYVEGYNPWILGRHPTDARMAIVWTPQIIFQMWIAERMHRSHTWVRHIWWVPQVVSISLHTQAVVHNSRLY